MEKVVELHKTRKSVVVAISEGIKLAVEGMSVKLTDQVGYVDAFGIRH